MEKELEVLKYALSFSFGCAVPSAYSFGTNLIHPSSQDSSQVSASEKPSLPSPRITWAHGCGPPGPLQASHGAVIPCEH